MLSAAKSGSIMSSCTSGDGSPLERQGRDRQSSPARMETPKLSSIDARREKEPISAPSTSSKFPESNRNTQKKVTSKKSVQNRSHFVQSSRSGVAATAVKSSATKNRLAMGTSTSVKPTRRTPDVTRATIRTPIAPPPSYARSNTASATKKSPVMSSNRGSSGSDGKRSSFSPKRVHKNPFGAML